MNSVGNGYKSHDLVSSTVFEDYLASQNIIFSRKSSVASASSGEQSSLSTPVSPKTSSGFPAASSPVHEKRLSRSSSMHWTNPFLPVAERSNEMLSAGGSGSRPTPEVRFSLYDDVAVESDDGLSLNGDAEVFNFRDALTLFGDYQPAEEMPRPELAQRSHSTSSLSGLKTKLSGILPDTFKRSYSEFQLERAQKLLEKEPPVKPAIPASVIADSKGEERSAAAQKIRALPYKYLNDRFEAKLQKYNDARELTGNDRIESDYFWPGRPLDEMHYKNAE